MDGRPRECILSFMTASERRLRAILSIQGLLYLAVNLWALIGTSSFLNQTDLSDDIFGTRRFAALSLIVSIFFLAGVWRKDLLRPASFLGLGSAIAIGLTELFHLPSIGWTILWIDFVAQIVLASFYIMTLFFNAEETPKPDVKEDAVKPEEPIQPEVITDQPTDAEIQTVEETTDPLNTEGAGPSQGL